jgi:hypothetical protein
MSDERDEVLEGDRGVEESAFFGGDEGFEGFEIGSAALVAHVVIGEVDSGEGFIEK